MGPSRYHSPRRADAAAATRAEILACAKDLFMTNGYAGTTVPQIARAARVAVPTVYASTGGKADILAALLATITDDPASGDVAAAISAVDDPARVIAIVGEGTWHSHRRHWDTIVGLFPQARSEPSAAAVHANILELYQAAIGVVADRLAELGGLRPGLSRDEVLDILWFYFGDAAWSSLSLDRGWPLERTRDWLITSATAALLGPVAPGPG
ncbi:TetR/AcrR family transcriptional regulator [Actinoplanes sp. NPDC026670]|uniref:TetR/AcrR family transcriptional regulator n=1 Tax=Actinoplanes sp. NPDC026670 TaxID=3154700 RepID=UPI0033EC0C2E